MPAWKVILFLLVVGAIAFAAVMFFVPDVRPEFVQKWFYPPATSAEDALDRFKKALEKRDFRAAARYCSGEYGEYLQKYHSDAKSLAQAIDDLKHAMKSHGVKSDKADFVLLSLDPFPPDFKFTVSKSNTATLDWSAEVAKHAGQEIKDWRVDNRAWNMMLLAWVGVASKWTVPVKEEGGSYKIAFPTSAGQRSATDQFEFLRKNASNFRNALAELGRDVKTNAPTKENFERDLKQKVEESK